MDGTNQTGQPWFISLNQAIESAMPDVTGLTSSIALINSQIGNFTLTQFTNLESSVNAIPTTYVAKTLFDSTIAAYQLQINNTNKLPYSLLSGTPDLSIYATKSGTTFTSDVQILGSKVLYVDTISPSTTSPSAMNYFLESVAMTKGLQISGALLSASNDIGTYLNVNGSATASGSADGLAVSNYTVNDTLTPTLASYVINSDFKFHLFFHISVKTRQYNH